MQISGGVFCNLAGGFKKEAVITPKQLPAQGSTKTDIFRGSVVTTASGIYLAFLDQGACETLTKVHVPLPLLYTN